MSRPCAPATNSSALSAVQRPQQQDPFGIEEVLHAEAAADVGRVEVDALRRQLEHELGELAADAVHVLPRQLELQRIGRGMVVRDAGARLERRHDHAVVHHVDLDDVRGRAHRLGHDAGIALLQMKGHVARRLIPQRGRVLGECRASIDDGRQRIVVDLDQLGRVARDLGVVGHDEGHRIADMTHTIPCQCKARRHDQRLDRRHAGHRPQPLEIGRNKNAMDAGQRLGRRQVDAFDDGVGMRRAQDMAPQAARALNVVHVTAAAVEETSVFHAPN
jgi:hypothetical protein